MLGLVLLCVIACASAVPSSDNTLNVYTFPPKYPEIGHFGHLSASLTKRQITIRDVYDRPVIILSEAGSPRKFAAYYAKNGLASISSNNAFKPLYHYLQQSSNILGLAFTTEGFPFVPVFFQNYVDNLIFPDNFKVEDLVEFAGEDVVILYVASEKDFKQCGFPKIVKIGTFSISAQSIVPVSYASQSHYPQKVFPFYFASPYLSYSQNFQKPVFSLQFHKPSVTSPTASPTKKVDSRLGYFTTYESPNNGTEPALSDPENPSTPSESSNNDASSPTNTPPST